MTPGQGRWVLSGGLASGKSEVRRLLEEMGAYTIDADQIGHSVLEPDGPAFAEVAAHWPEVLADGVIDRKALAGIVFNDPEQLARLETITHPHIFDVITARVKNLGAVVVVEIPLIDHGLGEGWRRMVVDSRDEIRLGRALERGMNEGDAKARMTAQPTRQQWLAVAEVVVPNHGSHDSLTATVRQLAESLRAQPPSQ